MPRKGSAYPIDQEWRRRVRERLTEMGITQNELGRRARVSKAALSDALSNDSKQSTCVPAIHRALGWPPPQPLVLSPDVQELLTLYAAMSEFDRGEMIGRARSSVEKQKKPR
jgi:transcriptional regulator with XRE-family HTH domain